MKEIEILVKVLSPKKKALQSLKRFKFIGSKETIDWYFYDPQRTNLKPSRGGRLTECFRLRQKDKKYLLAYKVDHFNQQGIWQYSDEHEVLVSNLAVMQKIIQHLGLKLLVKVDNIKRTYLTKQYEIVLEEVKGLGLFLEVESLNVPAKASVKTIKQEIWQFIKSLGIKVNPEVNAGKPELLLRKKSKR